MRTVLILFVVFVSTAAFAQTAPEGTDQKIGYADWDYIFTQMPEFKQIDSELRTHSSQLEAQLKNKYSEYETKYKAYQAGAATMVDAIRKDKEAELTQLQGSIEKFRQDATESISKKQTELLTPVQAKLKKAIVEVAKEQGFSFVFNPQVGGNDVLLHSEEKFDISLLVLKKFGITPPVDPKK